MPPMAGALLLAHPSLLDPNFRRSVVLLTAHDPDEGSLGVVVNRPLGKTLGEYDGGLQDSQLAGIPLYQGGPVAADQLILAAWKWVPSDGTFKLYFGIDADKARSLMQHDSGYRFRGFVGHSGWTEGQLTAELDQNAWLVAPLAPELEVDDGDGLWRTVISREQPELTLWAQEPDDPSLN